MAAALTTSLRKSVVVNLDVNIDADSNLTVFGQAPVSMTNIILAAEKIQASSLNGLIEFWEPLASANRGDINSHLDLNMVGSSPAVMSYKVSANSIFGDLKTVLSGAFDCSGAKPYLLDGASSLTSYAALPGFGRVALGQVAHAVFGHCAATAAITNDVDFETAMLASDVYAGGWVDISANVQSAVKANLAGALVKALVLKGYKTSPVEEYKDSVDAPLLTSIVKQVLGQDPSRARDQDNNVIAPEVHQPLKFYAGDIIYMSINVKYPAITMSATGGAATSQLPSSTQSGTLNATQVFDLKITLS